MPSVPLALHWHGAGMDERALSAAWAAAAEAGAAFAYAEQLQMLELVLDLWDRVPDAGAHHVGADRAGVMEEAAEAARLAGEPERGLPLAEAAVASLDAGRDAERLASLLRLRAALRQQLLLPGQLDDLRTALRLAARPTRVRALVLGQLIRILRLQEQKDEARSLAEELQYLARQLGDEAFGAEAQIRLTLLGGHDGDIIPALQHATEAAQRIGSGPLELLARVEITNTLQARGMYEAAIQAGRADLARAGQLGLARYVAAPIAANLAESLTLAGRWDEALKVIEESLAQGLAPFGREHLLVCRGEIAVARGDLETAARMVGELRAFPAIGAETQRALPLDRLDIRVRLAHGDLDGAVAAAGTVPGVHGRDPRYLWPLLAAAMLACADASIAGQARRTGRLAALKDTLAQAAAGTVQPGLVERAHAAMFAAEAARADGRLDRDAWDAAAAAWEAAGQPYPLACALLRAAEAALADRDRDAAAARLPQAADLAARLGARPLLQQVTRLASRARTRPPAGCHRPGGPGGPVRADRPRAGGAAAGLGRAQ